MRGTAGASAARAQMGPFGRNMTNATTPAPTATSEAKRIRPARVFGVVLGSEIMWKAKIMSAPLVIRCAAMRSGSPTHDDLPKRTAAYAARKAMVVSLRAERFTTNAPAMAIA